MVNNGGDINHTLEEKLELDQITARNLEDMIAVELREIEVASAILIDMIERRSHHAPEWERGNILVPAINMMTYILTLDVEKGTYSSE